MTHIPVCALAVFAVAIAGNIASALHCYKCSFVAQKNSINETIQLCNQFDYSQKYVVECAYSTMCMKKTFELTLPNGEIIKGTERGCASQKYEHQAYENGKWNLRANIEEPYEEGCHIEDDKGARLSPPQYCYCRRHLCNSATDKNEVSYHVDAMAVIFVFNAIRYFRSME